MTKAPKKIRRRVNEFEIQTLKKLAENCDCSIELLINALMANCVIEPLSQQIWYLKTGKLPGER